MNEKKTVYRLSIQYVRRGKLKNDVMYSSSLERVEKFEDEIFRKYPSATITRRTYKLVDVENIYGY